MQEMSSRPSDTKNLTGELTSNTLELYRQALIGKLVSSVVHEINNPLQAIQGSATLALESIANQNEVADYLHVIQRESARILKLTALMRSIYAPQKTAPEALALAELIRKLQPILKDDFIRRSIQLQIQIESVDTAIFVSADQVSLALLGTLLCLNQRLSDLSVTCYNLTFRRESDALHLQLGLGVPLAALQAEDLADLLNRFPELTFPLNLFEQQGARAELIASGGQAVLQISFTPEAQGGENRG
jgi:His Kinase A (phospho-acceptor) domain